MAWVFASFNHPEILMLVLFFVHRTHL